MYEWSSRVNPRWCSVEQVCQRLVQNVLIISECSILRYIKTYLYFIIPAFPKDECIVLWLQVRRVRRVPRATRATRAGEASQEPQAPQAIRDHQAALARRELLARKVRRVEMNAHRQLAKGDTHNYCILLAKENDHKCMR